MSIEVEMRGTLGCTVCGAQVAELRRGRCWSCYVRWTELRPVGRGASCNVCGERRRDNLRLVELHNRSLALCHNCASRTLKLSKVPESLDSIRRALIRDRRGLERRDDSLDHRIFPRERRVGDRRGPVRDPRDDTNPSFLLPDFDDLVIEIDEGDVEIIEQTVVRDASRVRGARDESKSPG